MSTPLTGSVNQVVPNVNPQDIDGTNFYYFDPIYIAQNSPNVDAGAAQFWSIACQNGYIATWENENEYLGAEPPTWLCPEGYISEAGGEVLCDVLLSWARARLWSIINGQPSVQCTYNGSPGSTSNLYVPEGWTVNVPEVQQASVSLTADNLVTVLQGATEEQITQVLTALFPGGAPQNVSLDYLIALGESGSPTELSGMAGAYGYPSTSNPDPLIQVLEAQNEAQKAATSCEILKEASTANNLQTQVLLDPELETSTLTFAATETGCAALTLIIAADILQSMTQKQNLNLFSCEAGLYTAEIAVLTSGAGAAQVSDFEYKAFVAQALLKLLHCCPPCQETAGPTYLVSEGVSTKLGNVPDGFEIARISAPSVTDNDKTNTIFGQPNLSLLAKMRYQFRDGNYSDVWFLNAQAQEKWVRIENVVDLGITPWEGVEFQLNTTIRPILRDQGF